VRALKTERVLASGGSLADAKQALNGEISPLDDFRSTAEYRRRVAENLLARFCTDTHCAQ
jgi:xanthine dehydrogenase iron-sulfur cluster and FAD-binding subunit A